MSTVMTPTSEAAAHGAVIRAQPIEQEIEDCHRQAQSDARSAVDHAIRCGQLLIQQKEKLKHGNFKVWVERRCEFFSYRTARVYMQVARRAQENGSALSRPRWSRRACAYTRRLYEVPTVSVL